MSAGTIRIALLGNPNCGKTALFNRLTGSRQKVANYAGVTVERKEGHFEAPSGRRFRVLDLPGAYSLDAASPDEVITRDVSRGHFPGEAPQDVLVCVVDATNLRLHLRFVLEVRALGKPMIVAVNMIDAAQRRGITLDLNRLQAELGVPVIGTVAVRKSGAAALIAQLDAQLPGPPVVATAPADFHTEVRRLLEASISMPSRTAAIDEKLDRIALHPVFGLVALSVLMFLIFQAVFSWAAPAQDAVSGVVASLSTWVTETLPDGPLRSLLTHGILAGLGTVLEFLPQILVLFAFILALEESGYLPRAAFLLDRLMFTSGLSGRSFIPLLSSFACAIPGIMATRSIQDPRDRLATIMVAPLMTCSARLPVYTLLIGAFIPRQTVGGFFNLQGLILFGLYLAGILSALLVAWILKRWRHDRGEHALLLELPSYRLPHIRDLALGLGERAGIFLRRVGGIILALTILLWFLSSYPSLPPDAIGNALDYSFAGRIGHAMEPLFAPIGFDWHICIALIPGLAAREVAVASLATVYALSNENSDLVASQLSDIVATEWSLATGMSLLVWYIYAPMCLSTLAVIRRETNSWRQVWISTGYLFGLAYFASFVVYQSVRLWE